MTIQTDGINKDSYGNKEIQEGRLIYAADAEASDTYVISLQPAATEMVTGMVVNFYCTTANIGAATLNINGLGAKTIKKNHDQDLATGDIEAGQIVTVVYDGTYLQMQSQSATAVETGDSPSFVTVLLGYTTTATAAGTTTLTVSSNYQQFFTGTTTQTVTMPVTSTLTLGQAWRIINKSTGVVTVNSSGGNAIVAMVANSECILTCILITGTTAASWDIEYSGISAVTGTGSMVLAISPTLVTPALGTPASGNLSNCTASTTDAAGVAELATDAETAAGTDTARALTPSNLFAVRGYDTIWIPATAMTPLATNGAVGGTYEYATNDINLDYMAFDGATEQLIGFLMPFPEGWDRSTILAKFAWSSATGSTAGDTVEWEIAGGALSDSDAIDAALGNSQVISDILLANNGGDMQITAKTPAITVGGTPALGDMLYFKVSRNVGGTDDMTENAWLFGVWIQYKILNSIAVW